MKNKILILTWIPAYQRSWLGPDIIAGATIWAVLVPLAMACALPVGVEPIVGLYTIPLALIGYAVFGGSQRLAVGPDAAVAVLAGGVIASIATGGDEHLALVIALALTTGAVYVMFFVLRMGWIADLVPEPVLKGFVEGIVWLTILKQASALLGLARKGTSQGFHLELIEVIKALPGTHAATAVLGVSSILVLILLRRLAPRVPGSLFVLLVSIILVGLLGLNAKGVAVLGEVESGMPDLGLPAGVAYDQIIALLPGALIIAVLGYEKSLAALKLVAEKTGERIEPNGELLAIGVSNIGAGLSGGYPVAGSLTATTVSLGTAGKSQLANIFAAVLSILTIAFLLPLLADLAHCILAAIIIVALLGASDLGYFRRLWALRRHEFMIGLAAFLGVLAFGVMPGVIIGVVLSLFKLAHAIHTPTTAIVGRTPSGAFVDIDERPDAKEIPGMLIWRQYGPMVFLNARVLSDALRSAVKDREDVRVVVLDATAAAGIDSTGADALIAARRDLDADGIDLWVVNPRQKGWKLVAALLEAANETILPAFDSLAEAVSRYESGKSDEAD